jgi:hypothetical protein
MPVVLREYECPARAPEAFACAPAAADAGSMNAPRNAKEHPTINDFLTVFM